MTSKKRKTESSISPEKKKRRNATDDDMRDINQIVRIIFKGKDDNMTMTKGQSVCVDAKTFSCAFSEIFSRLLCGSKNSQLPAPSLPEIVRFVSKIFFESEMEYCCVVVALVYIMRAVCSEELEEEDRSRETIRAGKAHEKETASAFVDNSNWKSMIMCSLVVASKLYDDDCMSNEDFAAVFGEGETGGEALTLSRLNQLEIEFLLVLDHYLHVTDTEYNEHAEMLLAEIELFQSVGCVEGKKGVVTEKRKDLRDCDSDDEGGDSNYYDHGAESSEKVEVEVQPAALSLPASSSSSKVKKEGFFQTVWSSSSLFGTKSSS